jgi:DNA-binding FadR family transcriptional regulator
MVELSGNQTLALMAGMVHEIILRQTQRSVRSSDTAAPTGQPVQRADFRLAVRAHEKLFDFIRKGEADEAERFWRRHLAAADELVLAGQQATRVLDVLD